MVLGAALQFAVLCLGGAVTTCERCAVVGGHCVGGGVRGAAACSLLDLRLALVAHAHVSALGQGRSREGHHHYHQQKQDAPRHKRHPLHKGRDSSAPP